MSLGNVMDSKLYQDYHDFEWGIKVYDDEILFKFLILFKFSTRFQLINHFFKKKQENFRKVFDNFDFKKIAKYHQSKCASLLLNDGIIRNKLNIRSAI